MGPRPQSGQPPLVAERLPTGARHAVPAQVTGFLLGDRDAVVDRPQPGEVPVEERLGEAVSEGCREERRTTQARDLPVAGPLRDLLEIAVHAEDRRGRLRAPA